MEAIDEKIKEIATCLALKIDEYRREWPNDKDKCYLLIEWKDVEPITNDCKAFYQYLRRMEDKGYIEHIQAVDLEDWTYHEIGDKSFYFPTEIKTDKKGNRYYEEDQKKYFLKDCTTVNWFPEDWEYKGRKEEALLGIFLITVDMNFEKIYDAKGKSLKAPDKSIVPLSLPPNTQWEDITLKMGNKYEVKIFIKGKYFGKTNNRKMGLYKANKDPGDNDADKQWDFLCTISSGHGEYDLGNATTQNKRDVAKQQKKKLSDALKRYFSIDSDPFDKIRQQCLQNTGFNEETCIYKTRFGIEPEPMLRENGIIDRVSSTKETHFLDDFLPKENNKKPSKKPKY